MPGYLFTSEAVSRGHPDKVADQISDTVLDACLTEDPASRVACETLVTKDLVVLAGEITTSASLDFDTLVREIVSDIGYTDPKMGFAAQTLRLETYIQQQSPDIARGVSRSGQADSRMGAGDQGLVFGYACDETPNLMPLPHVLAQEALSQLYLERTDNRVGWLCPDAKAQATVQYDADGKPERLHTLVVSTQHTEEISQQELIPQIVDMMLSSQLGAWIDDQTILHINPTGRFVLGGPAADTGLTGRKPIVDTYGGMGRHGGGAFSGKDPSKIDRSAAYAARYVAKNIVASGITTQCEVQLAYGIGLADPISIHLQMAGCSEPTCNAAIKLIPELFDLTPAGICSTLDLFRPIYLPTAWGGHFGREGSSFTWERTDKAAQIQKLLSVG